VLSHDDLDRLVDQCGDSVIKQSMYCARCGYNLRSLPYRYTCPECGNSYRARAHRRKGIFLEGETYFPYSECFILIISSLFSGLFITAGMSRWSVISFRLGFVLPALFMAGALLAVMAMVYVARSFRLFLEYKSRHQVTKRVAAQRREEAMHD